MKVAIIGGGICGLSLALNLHKRGIDARVYERAPEIKPLGVGITLLPHAMREFSALGLGEALLAAGIENRDSCFYNRFGQLIYREDRGKFAGYQYPEVGIHRGKLHVILYEAVKTTLGDGAVVTDCEAVRVEQDDAGATVQHRSRVRVDPAQPNLRQVHLIHRELFDELRTKGFEIAPGQIGENITTSGIDLLALPQAAVLRIGRDAVVEITGLRNPCVQLNTFRPGLMQACLGRDADGALLLKAGVMGVIRQGGMVMAGDAITVELPALPHRKLERV